MNLRLFWTVCLTAVIANLSADTIVFRQNAEVLLNNVPTGSIYYGVQDAELRSADPTTNFDTGSGTNEFTLDGSDGGGSTQLALRFDDIFGPELGQIPTNVVINSATLRLTITNEGNDFSLYRIANDIEWTSASATWNNFGTTANDGILVGVETAGSPLGGLGAAGVADIDVTPLVQAWADGATNTGFAFFPGGSNGVDIDASESVTSNNRPTLSIDYTLLNPNAPSFTDNAFILNDARSTLPYVGSIQTLASDPDNDTLAFSKLSGPAWLQIASNGELSGVPNFADMGENSFIVRVTDHEDGTDNATLRINVNDENGNPLDGAANATRLRLVWVNDPATTITVCWDQTTGSDATVYYGPEDLGRAWSAYPYSKSVDRAIAYRGMNNRFARLSGLQPDTNYFFVLKDSGGTSERYWFKTAPATPQPFSFIAGGDSRNNREPRQSANQLVGKLRPLFVAFTGDMISSDADQDWLEWMDDWQQTNSDDGRMYPLLPHRGNHETGGNTTIYNLFDTTPGNYYGVNFGGHLLRYYVLNSESAQPTQATWLQGDLNAAGGASTYTHLCAGYHKPMRPHTSSKSEGSSEYSAWANLFHQNRFDLAIESDSHVMKRTKPLVPSIALGSEEGFIEDAINGTVYIGEGCWGAPLRDANDNKDWTIASGSFNGFDWVHVYEDRMEIFTVQVDNASDVFPLTDFDHLTLPQGISLWQPVAGARHIAGLRNGQPARSFAQWQLDNFGSSIEANETAKGDHDQDGTDNLIEFALNLNDHIASTGKNGQAPIFTIDQGAKKLAYHRPLNSGVSYRYQASTNMRDWSVLESGVDYAWSTESNGDVEDVTITLLGDFATQSQVFLRMDFSL